MNISELLARTTQGSFRKLDVSANSQNFLLNYRSRFSSPWSFSITQQALQLTGNTAFPDPQRKLTISSEHFSAKVFYKQDRFQICGYSETNHSHSTLVAPEISDNFDGLGPGVTGATQNRSQSDGILAKWQTQKDLSISLRVQSTRNNGSFQLRSSAATVFFPLLPDQNESQFTLATKNVELDFRESEGNRSSELSRSDLGVIGRNSSTSNSSSKSITYGFNHKNQSHLLISARHRTQEFLNRGQVSDGALIGYTDGEDLVTAYRLGYRIESSGLALRYHQPFKNGANLKLNFSADRFAIDGEAIGYLGFFINALSAETRINSNPLVLKLDLLFEKPIANFSVQYGISQIVPISTSRSSESSGEPQMPGSDRSTTDGGRALYFGISYRF